MKTYGRNLINLSQVISRLNKFNRECSQSWDEGYAFGAPMDELAPLINKGEQRAFRHMRRALGMSQRQVNKAVRDAERRTSKHYIHQRLGLRYDYSNIH